MTSTHETSSQTQTSRGSCVLLLVALFAFLGLAAMAIPFLREQQRQERERRLAHRRQDEYELVKKGKSSVLVVDSSLLPMLAGDCDCVDNVTELNFTSATITRDDARFLSRLKNVRSLNFYDSDSADMILEQARQVPITKIFFEMSRPSKESLRSLSEFPDLTYVHFEDIMRADEMEILVALPSRIKVHMPHSDVD